MAVIPYFDIHGLVPPIRPGEAGHSLDRSPYPTDMLAFCQRFGTSADRRRILSGLLALRGELRGSGVTDGYQWLDGSFLEDVERLRGRPPQDIDVVTFAVLGDGAAQRAKRQAAPHLFDSAQCKMRFHVDHYVLRADRALDEAYARRVAYWYSMWSHQRGSHRWKGFVSVPLASNDLQARAFLDISLGLEEGTP